MRDFKLVMGYELKRQLAKKTVIVTTIILMVVALVLTCIPLIQHTLFQDKADDISLSMQEAYTADPVLSEKTGYVFASDALKDEYLPLLGLKDENLFANREDLVLALKEKTINSGFVFYDESNYEAVYQDKGMEDKAASLLLNLMTGQRRDKLLSDKGLTPQDLRDIENFQPQMTETVMGRSFENNIMVSMIMMVAIYMLVLLYGSATSVMIAREKDSKAMELLITSTKPSPLILGKVAASGISGIVQFSLIALSGLLGFFISRQYYDPMLMMMLQGSLSQSYVLTYIFFSVTGYLLYLFLYAALGSTVSRVEDVGSATALVQFIFIAGYIASSTVIYAPAGAVAVITSLIPFTAVMVMPIRAGMMTVPLAQLLISGALMLVTLAFFAFLSIKIYRWDSLNYGNKTNLIKIVREALRSEKRQK